MRGPRPARGFVERSLDGLLHAMELATAAEAGASARGWMQRRDPRVKVAAVCALAAAVALSHGAGTIAALLALGVALAAASRIPVSRLWSGAWLAAVGFTSALAVPALFLTPGRTVATVPMAGWTVTAQGMTSAGLLVLRVAATATFALLLVFTTRWPHVLKALGSLRLPAVFVVVLAMTYRYVLLLLDAAHDMFVARRSRTVTRPTSAERRRAAAQGAGVLLSRSMQLSGDVYLAMQSRGFRGEVYVVDDFAMARADWFALGAAAAVTAVAIWAGR